MPITLYHRTTAAVARAILADGFTDDAEEHADDGATIRGVRLFDPPPDPVDFVGGDTLLEVVLSATVKEVTAYEVIEEEPPPFQEWLMPADFINGRKLSVRVDDESD